MSRRTIIVGVVAALLILGAIFFLVLPTMGKVSKTQDDLQAAQQEGTSLEAQLAALEQAEADAPETQQEIAKLEEQVPPEADIADLIGQLQAAADRASVDFFSFSPGTPTVSTTGTYSIMASSVTANGTYFSVDEFLFLLETLPRAAKVTQIAISPTGGGDTTTVATAPTSGVQLVASVEFYTTDLTAGPGAPAPTGPTGSTGGVTGRTGVTGATGPSTPQVTGASP